MGRDEKLGARIKEIAQMKNIPNTLVDDLNWLKQVGNRTDHEELSDITPQEKPEIVHRTYRVALFMTKAGAKLCRDPDNCKFGPDYCKYLHLKQKSMQQLNNAQFQAQYQP